MQGQITAKSEVDWMPKKTKNERKVPLRIHTMKNGQKVIYKIINISINNKARDFPLWKGEKKQEK